MARRMPRRLRVLIGVAALPLALFAVLPLVSSGEPKNLGSKIEQKKDQIQWRKGRERVLSTDIAGYTQQDQRPAGRDHDAADPQMRLQTSLDAKRAELARIQEDLRRERLRLARLRARLAEARKALAARLVELYKADQPDLVTVVLESNGFADLLERTEFMQRVSHQDARIIGIVRRAKADATATAAAPGPPGEAGQGRSPTRSRTTSTRSSRSRTSSSTAAAATPTCARRSRRCSPARGPTATSSRATCARSRPSRRRCSRRCRPRPAAAAAPRPPARSSRAPAA